MGQSVGSSRRAVSEGRHLRRTAAAFGEEFRGLRLRAGVSQAAVARAIGVDRAVICRLEAGDPGVTAAIRSRAAALLGATFKFALYPDASPLIRDAAHARLVDRLLGMRHPRWQATLEAPVPGPGHRSSDIRLVAGRDVVLVEVESHVGAVEEILRELHSKRQATRAAELPTARVHVALALPATRHHRALVRAHPAVFEVAFAIHSEAIESAIRSPAGDWPGDGLLWVPGHREARV
ncbi:MAG TPA: helix-turn-helix transcriptional regulator [Candidatus Limnocylindrales bacterium]